MASINPYIHFNGNAQEAFSFYQSVFGGTFERQVRYKDMAGDQHPISENDADKLMHISLPVGKNNYIMGSDTIEQMGRVNENDNRNSIAIDAESRSEADTLFNGLSAGGQVEMPMMDAPFGYFGMFTDKFGIQWLINFDANKK